MSATKTISKFKALPKQKQLFLIGGVALATAGILGFAYREEIVTAASGLGPSGVRNNNPANIRIDSSNWQGVVPKAQNTDGRFHQFSTMEYGMRAHMVLLRNYQTKYGLNTIRKITHRWAPYGDGSNNPDNYAEFVAKEVGVSPDTPINLLTNTEVLAKVAHAMAIQENGWIWEPAFNLKKYRSATRMLGGLAGIVSHTQKLLAA